MSHTARLNRNATFSWSPLTLEKDLIVCGSVSNPKSACSDPRPSLDIFKVSSSSPELLSSVYTSAHFSRILWTSVEAGARDLLICAFDNGTVELWDSSLLLESKEALIDSRKIHSGPVKGLAASYFQRNLIVSGSVRGEIALWDLNAPGKTSLLSFNRSNEFADVAAAEWNRRVPYIIGACSDSGAVSVIDLRSKKETVSFKLPDSASASSLAWNPEMATELVVASCADFSPSSYLWDLRKAEQPIFEFNGHTSGVLSLSWNDKRLLSAGRDCRVILWDTENRVMSREFSDHSDWVHDVKWSLKDSNVFASSSFDGSILIQSIARSVSECNDNESLVPPSNEAVQNSPSEMLNRNSTEAPCCSAVFGPRGLCIVAPKNGRNIYLFKPSTEDILKIKNDLTQFIAALKEDGPESACDLAMNCQGFSADQASIFKLIGRWNTVDTKELIYELLHIEKVEGNATVSFDDSIQYSNLSDLPEIVQTKKSLLMDSKSSIEDLVTDCLLKSNFVEAIAICIAAEDFSGALLISNHVSAEVRSDVESFVIKSSKRDYLRLASALGRNNLSDIILNSSIDNWKPVFQILFDFAPNDSFSDLFGKFSIRLEKRGFTFAAACAAFLSSNFLLFFKLALSLAMGDSNQSGTCQLLQLSYRYRIILLHEHYQTASDAGLTEQISSSLAMISEVFESFGFSGMLKDSSDNETFSLKEIEATLPKLESYSASSIGADSFLPPTSTQLPQHPSSQSQSQSHSHSQSQFTSSYQTAPNISLASGLQEFPSSISNVDALNYPSLATNSIRSFLTTTWTPPSPKTYNDAPMVNPRNSLILQSKDFGNLDLSAELVQVGLQNLFNSVNQRASETQFRMVSESQKKLSAIEIWSLAYSSATKSIVIALYNYLNLNDFEKARELTSSIIATSFSETKDWVLHVKRLLDVIFKYTVYYRSFQCRHEERP